MFALFNRLRSIRIKLLLQFATILVLSALLMIFTLTNISKIIHFEKMRNDSQELNNIILQMRRAEKDFMLRDVINDAYFKTGESKQILKFETFYKNGLEEITQLESYDVLSSDSLNYGRQLFSAYRDSFLDLVELYRKKGFKDWGHEGEMRKAIHSIENSKTSYDTILLLMLRRHEKDFLLRKNPADIEKFEAKLVTFKSRFQDSGNSDMLTALNSYGEQMAAIVEKEKAIGLSENEGVKGEMRAAINKLEPMIARINDRVVQEVDETVSNVYVVCIILFAIQLIIGIALSVAFANSITKIIRAIQDRIEKLSNGVFPEKISLESHDELGVTSNSLNNLVDRIKAASTFASQIGNGQLNMTYDESFNNDVLANALQGMQEKLKETSEENERRNWVASGLAKFAELLRGNENDLRALCQHLISGLLKYLNANQGQVYVVQKTEDGEEQLELMGTYAWGRNKHMQKYIIRGEGLIGQVWLEKQTTYLKEFPKDFIQIRSGLGEAEPSRIVIVPLKFNDEVFGVLEVASFKEIHPYQVEFLEKVSELFASTISATKVNERTRKLLHDSQMQGEQLRAQEEEMRQNMEELTATQEEMGRKDVEMRGYFSAIDTGFMTIEFESDGKIISANQKFQAVLGLAADQIEGHHHHAIIDQETKSSHAYKKMWEDLRHGIPQSRELKYNGKDGSIVWLHQQFTPVATDGQYMKIVSIGTDITRYKALSNVTTEHRLGV
jgi:PAS domain S-box-containing protein